MFLIHLLAWPWGSMKWVQRWENWLMTPFSTDSVSLGRPAICGASGWVRDVTQAGSAGATATPSSMLGYLVPLLVAPLEVGAGDSVHGSQPTGP